MMLIWVRVILRMMMSLTISNKRCTLLGLRLLTICYKTRIIKTIKIIKSRNLKTKCIRKLFRNQKHTKC